MQGDWSVAVAGGYPLCRFKDLTTALTITLNATEHNYVCFVQKRRHKVPVTVKRKNNRVTEDQDQQPLLELRGTNPLLIEEVAHALRTREVEYEVVT